MSEKDESFAMLDQILKENAMPMSLINFLDGHSVYFEGIRLLSDSDQVRLNESERFEPTRSDCVFSDVDQVTEDVANKSSENNSSTNCKKKRYDKKKYHNLVNSVEYFRRIWFDILRRNTKMNQKY